MNPTKIHIWDLPEDVVYVDLNQDFKKRFFKSLKSFSGWKDIPIQLDITFSNLTGILYKHKRIKLKTLRKITELSKTDKDLVERNINTICLVNNGGGKLSNAIINPKLPFDFNNIDGARIIAAIFFDGGIDACIYPNYRNTNIELRKRVYGSFVNIFGEFNAAFTNYNNREQIYFPKIVGIILTKGLGLLSGRKTTNNPSIPSFIMNASKDMKSVFLQQAYDDEGHMHNNTRSVDFKLANGLFVDEKEHQSILESNNVEYAPNLIKGVKQLVEDFGIKTTTLKCAEIYKTKIGQYNTKWTFEMCGKKNLEIFRDNINFISDYKRDDLDKSIASFVQEQYPRDKSEGIIYEACLNLQRKQGKITSRTLAKEINRSQVRAKKTIYKLVRKGLLKLSKPRNGSKGAEYEIISSSNIS